MTTLFFSYSHRDEAPRNELEVHLSMLKRQGILETWHDRRITAGEEFDKTISQNLEKADIILLLVVVTCNHKPSNLQSRQFQTRINCNYKNTQTSISCN